MELQKATKLNPPKIIAISFLTAIIVGTLLLSLPIATTKPGSMPVLDALFTSASAVCVTGLIVVDTGTYFTRFGQTVILLLFQVGGLGIMTLSTFFLILLGKRLLMKDLFVIKGSIGSEPIYGIRALVKYILLITFIFEFIGTIILAWRFHVVLHLPFWEAVYYGVFHSISAFCNAGFSLFNDSFMGFQKDPITVLCIGILVILGGLGFIVLLNITTYKFWVKDRLKRGRWKFQTKMVVTMSGILLLIGFIGLLCLEWSNTLTGLGLRDKIVNALFGSLTPRTAGFNTLPVYEMRLASLALILFLMFVGASPGSTGGGIKTSTFMVLLANTYSIMNGQSEVHLFDRTIPKRVIQEAISIVGIALTLIFIFTFSLLITEGFKWGLASTKAGFIKILFEVISAFSNVGLTTGITPALSNAGKLIIIITMYIGRISPLTLALVVGRREQEPPIGYPVETVMVG